MHNKRGGRDPTCRSRLLESAAVVSRFSMRHTFFDKPSSRTLQQEGRARTCIVRSGGTSPHSLGSGPPRGQLPPACQCAPIAHL